MYLARPCQLCICRSLCVCTLEHAGVPKGKPSVFISAFGAFQHLDGSCSSQALFTLLWWFLSRHLQWRTSGSCEANCSCPGFFKTSWIRYDLSQQPPSHCFGRIDFRGMSNQPGFAHNMPIRSIRFVPQPRGPQASILSILPGPHDARCIQLDAQIELIAAAVKVLKTKAKTWTTKSEKTSWIFQEDFTLYTFNIPEADSPCLNACLVLGGSCFYSGFESLQKRALAVMS